MFAAVTSIAGYVIYRQRKAYNKVKDVLSTPHGKVFLQTVRIYCNNCYYEREAYGETANVTHLNAAGTGCATCGSRTYDLVANTGSAFFFTADFNPDVKGSNLRPTRS